MEQQMEREVEAVEEILLCRRYHVTGETSGSRRVGGGGCRRDNITHIYYAGGIRLRRGTYIEGS